MRIFAVFAALFLSGCMIVPQPSSSELQLIEHPTPEMQRKLDHFLPRTLAWFQTVEADLAPKGRSLTPPETAYARKVGVHDPSLVRIVVLEIFPMPQDPELRAEAERFGLGSQFEGGRTMGHVIMLKPDLAEATDVITHELNHVGQQNRLGRAAFLKRYLTELEVLGYARAPLELEAYEKQVDRL